MDLELSMGRGRYTSDYFQQLYDWAVKMIKDEGTVEPLWGC
jgi:hypothetical protein